MTEIIAENPGFASPSLFQHEMSLKEGLCF